MTKPPKTLHIALADNNQRLRCWTASAQEAHQLRADGVPMHTYDLRGPIPNDGPELDPSQRPGADSRREEIKE